MSKTDTEILRKLEIVSAEEARNDPSGVGHGIEEQEALIWKLRNPGKIAYRERFKSPSDLVTLIELKNLATQSPLFNASLSSKELFHSNFIAWTIDPNTGPYGQDFLKYFFDSAPSVETPIYDVQRESKNLDISFSHGQDVNRVDCIIELKVKSIPYMKQLAEYALKYPRADKLLMCAMSGEQLGQQLVEFDKANPDIRGWKVVSLSKLVSFYQMLSAKTTGYHSYLFADYAQALQVILGVCEQIDITMNEERRYGFQDDGCNDKLKVLRELRVYDFYLKGCYEQMASQVIKHLNQKGIPARPGKKPRTPDTSSVIVETGFTRSQGLLDLSVDLAPNIYAGIQIQGYQFKYYVEVPVKQLQKHKTTLHILKDDWFDRMETLCPSPLVPRNTEKVNQYEGAFLYRYFWIPDVFVDTLGLSFDDLYGAITSSVEALLQFREAVWEAGVIERPDVTQRD